MYGPQHLRFVDVETKNKTHTASLCRRLSTRIALPSSPLPTTCADATTGTTSSLINSVRGYGDPPSRRLRRSLGRGQTHCGRLEALLRSRPHPHPRVNHGSRYPLGVPRRSPEVHAPFSISISILDLDGQKYSLVRSLLLTSATYQYAFKKTPPNIISS